MRRSLFIGIFLMVQNLYSQKNGVGIHFAPINTLSLAATNSSSTSDINYAIGFNYYRMIGKKVALAFEPNYTSILSEKMLSFHVIELPTLCRFFIFPRNTLFIDVGSSNAFFGQRAYFEPYYTVSAVLGVGYQYHLNDKIGLAFSLRTRSPYIIHNSRYAVFNTSFQVSGYYKF